MSASDALDDMDLATKLVLVGGGVVILGALLPWRSIEFMGMTDTVSGVDDGGDGIFTIAFAAVAIGVAYARDWDTTTGAAVVVLGVLVTALAAYYITDPLVGADVPEADQELAEQMVDVGIGLYLTALGGLVIAAGGVKGYQDRSSGESTGAAVEATNPEAEP